MSVEEGKKKTPFGFVIPVQRDMTKAAEMVNILRIQRIEVGQASAPFTVGGKTYAAGSYVIKRDQPYGRLAKNLIEKQQYPDSRISTYDDSGWSMGLAMMVDVVEVADSAILKVATTPVTTAKPKGTVKGNAAAGIAVGTEWRYAYLLGILPALLCLWVRAGLEEPESWRRAKQEHPGQAIAAYGNSASDLPHLEVAEHPLLVNGSARARRRAAERSAVDITHFTWYVPAVHTRRETWQARSRL